MKPSEALKRQRNDATKVLLGCSEKESMAELVLEFLAVNGDSWDTSINWRAIANTVLENGRYHIDVEYLKRHSHVLGGDPETGVRYIACDFENQYMKVDVVNAIFIGRMQGKSMDEIPEANDEEWSCRQTGILTTEPKPRGNNR